MALNLEKDEGSGWVAVNLTTVRVANFKLKIGYSHPAELTFTIYDDHHTTPIEPFAAIRFWDDAANDSDGDAFSSSNPTFLGFVEDVDPDDDGHQIRYTCLDPTARVNNQVPIMSAAWTSSTAEALGAVPRLIFNATIDNDDDYTFSRDNNLTAGEMIETILDDALLRLRAFNAAPSASDAYVQAEIDAMDFETQEKVVFTSEPVRSGISRVLNDWEPEFRLLFHPGDRTWLFRKLNTGTQVTRTLNDFTETHPILQFRLDRSLEERYTAVKIYGPEAAENREITESGGGLTDVSDGPEIDTYGAGISVTGKNKWRIADTTRRRMARLLPTAIYAPTPEYRLAANAHTQYGTWTRSPTFMARWKDNNGGTDAWQTISGWWYEPSTGILTFNDSYVYRYNDNPSVEGGVLQPNYENPEDVMLIYPSYIEPLSVRRPASGYEGSAYDDYDHEAELKIYDEMLAVGFLYGTPVTSATRVAKFQTLAQKILNAKKDTIHTGGMVLDGLDYEWHLLGRRVNVDGVDGAGAAKTTGWESINAIVTDVEYDYEEQQTTVQFSSDHAELLGFDPERVKAELKIGASRIVSFLQWSVRFSTRRAFTEFGTPIIGQDVLINAAPVHVVIDPHLGTVEAPITSTG